MANEITTTAATGSTLYAMIRNSALKVWSVTGSALVTWVDANYAQYKVAMTEQGTSGFFSANFPAISAADFYTVEIFSGAGSESDTFVAGGQVYWNGTAVAPNPTPPVPGNFYGYFYTVDTGGHAVANVTINYALTAPPSGSGLSFDANPHTATSDGNGLIQISMTPGATYSLWSGNLPPAVVAIPANATSPYALADFIYSS